MTLFAAGVGLALAVAPHAAPCAAAGMAAAAAWIVALAAGRQSAASRCAGLGVFLLGALLALRSVTPDEGSRLLGSFSGRPVRLEGTVAGMPRDLPGGVSLRLDCRRVQVGGRTCPVEAPVRLSVWGTPARPLRPGDLLRVETTLRVPWGKRFAGDADRSLALAGEDIHLTAGVEAGPRLVAAGGRTPQVWRPLLAFAASASSVFAQLGQPADGLLHALILGRTHRLEADLLQDFRRSGLAHILSVSGLHVGIFGLASYALALLLLRRWPALAARTDVRRAAALAALPPMVFYTLVTGAAPPAVRSLVMAGLFFLGVAAGRSSSSTGSLCLAALLILAWSPPALYSPSFQLSFAAAVAIVLTAGRLPGLFRETGSGWRGVLTTSVPRCLAISLAAFLATLPLAAYHFSLVAPAGVAAGLAAIPLFSYAVLPFGLAAGLLAPLWPQAANLVALPAAWGARLLACLAGLCSAGGGLCLEGFRPSPAQAAALYFMMASFLFPWTRRGRYCLALGAALMLAATLALAVVDGGGTRVTFLDVGQGDAALVEPEGGGAVLVDAGGRGENYDRGARVVAPFLRARRVVRLEAMVLTHGHPDHAGGAGAVLADFEAGVVCVPAPAADEPWVGQLPREAVKLVAAGDVLDLGAASVSFLWPPRGGSAAIGQGNTGSLVAAICTPAGRLLFSGDVDSRVLERLAREVPGDLPAAVVKVPHHGSRHSWSESYYLAAAPREAVISSGQNSYGHPDAGVVEALSKLGVVPRLTAESGSVEVLIRPGESRTWLWSGRGHGLSPHGLWHWLWAGG